MTHSNPSSKYRYVGIHGFPTVPHTMGTDGGKDGGQDGEEGGDEGGDGDPEEEREKGSPDDH